MGDPGVLPRPRATPHSPRPSAALSTSGSDLSPPDGTSPSICPVPGLAWPSTATLQSGHYLAPSYSDTRRATRIRAVGAPWVVAEVVDPRSGGDGLPREALRVAPRVDDLPALHRPSSSEAREDHLWPRGSFTAGRIGAAEGEATATMSSSATIDSIVTRTSGNCSCKPAKARFIPSPPRPTSGVSG